MTRADMLAGEFRQEAQVTRRVLERMPEDKMGWKPHEKSWSMAELATHIANLPMWSQSIINEDEFDINPPGGSDYEPPKAETKDEILEAFDRNVGTAADTFAGQSDEGYAAPWTFKERWRGRLHTAPGDRGQILRAAPLDPSPGSALALPPAHGRRHPADLRAVSGRDRDVTGGTQRPYVVSKVSG